MSRSPERFHNQPIHPQVIVGITIFPVSHVDTKLELFDDALG